MTVGIEKSYSIDDYIQKLFWLEEVSNNMKLNNQGWLVWDSFFDGELYTIKVRHAIE